MSQIKLGHKLSKHSQLFRVATQGYLALLKEISAASDDQELKRDIELFVKHLKGPVSEFIAEEPSLITTPQSAQSPQSLSHLDKDHLSPPPAAQISSPPSTPSPFASLAEALKATKLVTLEEPYHEDQLLKAWRDVHLCSLHFTSQYQKELLAPLQSFQVTTQEKEIVIFADRDLILVPAFSVQGKQIGGAVRLSADRDSALSMLRKDQMFGGVSAKMIGMINTIYYLYEHTPHLLSAYQAITPRGYEEFTEVLTEQWQISISHILEKLASKTTFSTEDSKLLVDLDEAISSIFPSHTTPHTHSWFEGLLAQLRYELSNTLRSLGVKRFNWTFSTLASASSETSNNLLYREPNLDPGTVLRVLRASVDFPHWGVREGRVLYSSR